MVSIHPASHADIDLLTTMNTHMVEDMGAKNWPSDRYQSRFKAWIKGGHWEVDLFERDGDIVGYTAYQRRQDHFDTSLRTIFIRHFFIVREHRRQGLGRSAFEALVETRFNRGAAITLDVLPSTEDALGFWRALGFDTYYTVLKRDIV